MTTFGRLKERIENELQRDSTDSELSDAIVASIDFYRRQRFNWNTKRATTATVAAVEYYQLPPDYVEADSLRLTKDHTRDHLTERSFVWIDAREGPDNQYARPAVFSIQNREMRLYPIPDQSYTILLSYVYALPEISVSAADSATNAWMTEAEELIRLHAKADLLMNRIRGPESLQEAMALTQREERIASDLRREYKRAQSSGRLSPSMI